MSEQHAPVRGADGVAARGADGVAARGADSVDALVAAWRRERPDLDVTPLEVLSRVSRLARHLDIARRTAFARHDLETGEFDVLAALRRSGAPYAMSPGRLAAETLVASGTMTNRLDQLERDGLVARTPDTTDRRGVSVTLTTSGRDRVDAALADLLAQEKDILRALPDDDQRNLVHLLRTLTVPFDAP